MIFEKSFQLLLAEPRENLLMPEKVFAGREPFGKFERRDNWIEGDLGADVPLLGEVRFPFRGEIMSHSDDRAELKALPIEPAPSFWAELWGVGGVASGGLEYQLNLRIHARLPEGEKWGGKVLKRMAEAAFERVFERALQQLAKS